MGPEGAANIIFRKEIMEAENPDEMRQQKVKEYKEKFANPYVAASKGYIDSVIAPEETRNILLHAIEVSGRKGCKPSPQETWYSSILIIDKNDRKKRQVLSGRIPKT